MEVIKDTHPTAKKVHYCDWCGAKIEVGETYHSQTCVDGGDIWVFKTHLKCDDIANLLEMYDDLNSDEGLDNHMFEGYIADHVQFNHRDDPTWENLTLQETIQRILSQLPLPKGRGLRVKPHAPPRSGG